MTDWRDLIADTTAIAALTDTEFAEFWDHQGVIMISQTLTIYIHEPTGIAVTTWRGDLPEGITLGNLMRAMAEPASAWAAGFNVIRETRWQITVRTWRGRRNKDPGTTFTRVRRTGPPLVL